MPTPPPPPHTHNAPLSTGPAGGLQLTTERPGGAKRMWIETRRPSATKPSAFQTPAVCLVPVQEPWAVQWPMSNLKPPPSPRTRHRRHPRWPRRRRTRLPLLRTCAAHDPHNRCRTQQSPVPLRPSLRCRPEPMEGPRHPHGSAQHPSHPPHRRSQWITRSCQWAVARRRPQRHLSQAKWTRDQTGAPNLRPTRTSKPMECPHHRHGSARHRHHRRC